MSGAGTQTPKPGICTINPRRSQVRFRTRHMFGLGPVRGTFGIDRSARGTEDGAAFEATTTIDRYASGFTKGMA